MLQQISGALLTNSFISPRFKHPNKPICLLFSVIWHNLQKEFISTSASGFWISSKKVSTYREELAPQLSLSWIVPLKGRFHNFATPHTTLLLGTTPSDKPPWCTQLLARRIIGASSAVQYTVYSICGRSRQNLVYTCRTGTQTGLTRLQTSYNRPVRVARDLYGRVQNMILPTPKMRVI